MYIYAYMHIYMYVYMYVYMSFIVFFNLWFAYVIDSQIRQQSSSIGEGIFSKPTLTAPTDIADGAILQ
jgi:hypothetical protein